MKKERRQIWLIGIFLLAGCVFGYFGSCIHCILDESEYARSGTGRLCKKYRCNGTAVFGHTYGTDIFSAYRRKMADLCRA